VATVIVVVLATNAAADDLPKDIDVVIIKRPLSVDSEDSSSGYRGIENEQVLAIDRNMPFRRNIYILSDGGSSSLSFPGVDRVYHVDFLPGVTPSDPEYEKKSLDEYFLYSPHIKDIKGVPDIAQHAIFLSDQTVPMRKILKPYLFIRERPRTFNIFRDASQMDLLGSYFNYTTPTLVEDLGILDDSDTVRSVKDFIFLKLTEDRITLRHDLNRDVLVLGDAEPSERFVHNRKIQYKELTGQHAPLFATFHISGNISEANISIQTYLTTQFNLIRY
jgi:hypothetical protein